MPNYTKIKSGIKLEIGKIYISSVSEKLIRCVRFDTIRRNLKKIKIPIFEELDKEEKRMVKTLIVAGRVKELSEKFCVGKDFTPELEKRVEFIIRSAMKRAQANNRTTIMAKDL